VWNASFIAQLDFTAGTTVAIRAGNRPIPFPTRERAA